MTALLPGKTSKSAGPTGNKEPFTYTTEAGQTITVASLAAPFKTAGELRKMRKASPIDLAYYVIERDCDEETLEIVDEMSWEEFNEVFSKQWAEHSGIALGE
jgi:hypothetical protein